MKSKSIRTLIIDDEQIARRGIRARLKSEPDISVVGECEDGLGAVEMIRAKSPDLIFLDIQMPELDGFEVLEALGPAEMPVVIFVTAYNQFAMKAFTVHALDYLLKPVKPDLFTIALDRARAILQFHQSKQYGDKISDLIADITSDRKYLKRFIVRSAGAVRLVEAHDIDWIEAYGDYVRIHAGGKKHLLRKTLTDIIGLLDPSAFVRIHRSAIVRVDRISSLRPLTNGDYTITLTDRTQLSLSRTHREHFFNTVQISG